MSCRIKEKINKLFDTVAPELYKSALGAIDTFGMHRLIEGGVLLGLSGGADSVFLLCFLIEYRKRTAGNFKISACHVNHMIRGDEAVRDLEFSQKIASSLDVDFYSESIDIPALSREMGCGIEEAAREARYSVFDKLINENESLSSVALAHNASDNLETVLFNMMRGSGLRGICGISPIRDNIVRPLIHIPKCEIVRALGEAEIDYVTDSSNLTTDYTRNYIRHKIVPTLYELNDSPENAVSRLTETLISDNKYLTSVAESALYQLGDKPANKDLLSLDTAVLSRVLAIFYKERTGITLENKHIKEIVAHLGCDDFALSLGGEYSFICDRGICTVLSKEDQLRDDAVYFLAIGENKFDKYDAMITVSTEKNNILSNVYKFSIHADLPSAIIKDGLHLRFRREGDSLKIKGHTKRLKKVFNDRNIPRHERDRIPIICDSEGILWIPGLGVRDHELNSSEKQDKVRITLNYNINNTNNCFTTARPR